jgi:hypothetical protein
MFQGTYMKNFLTTIAFAVTILAVVPACAKKTTKQEPVKVEAAEPAHKEVSNDKENYTV